MFLRNIWFHKVQLIRKITKANSDVKQLVTFVEDAAFECNDPVYERLQLSDAMDEATFLAAAQPLDEIIGYIGAASVYHFAKKYEPIDALLRHMAYTRKKTAFSQYVHELIMPNTMGSL